MHASGNDLPEVEVVDVLEGKAPIRYNPLAAFEQLDAARRLGALIGYIDEQ